MGLLLVNNSIYDKFEKKQQWILFTFFACNSCISSSSFGQCGRWAYAKNIEVGNSLLLSVELFLGWAGRM